MDGCNGLAKPLNFYRRGFAKKCKIIENHQLLKVIIFLVPNWQKNIWDNVMIRYIITSSTHDNLTNMNLV